MRPDPIVAVKAILRILSVVVLVVGTIGILVVTWPVGVIAAGWILVGLLFVWAWED